MIFFAIFHFSTNLRVFEYSSNGESTVLDILFIDLASETF